MMALPFIRRPRSPPPSLVAVPLTSASAAGSVVVPHRAGETR